MTRPVTLYYYAKWFCILSALKETPYITLLLLLTIPLILFSYLQYWLRCSDKLIFFTNVGTNLHQNETWDILLTCKLFSTYCFRSSDTDEKYISEGCFQLDYIIKDFKSSGVDGIIPEQLLETGEQICVPFGWIKFISERGRFPFKWKKGWHYFFDTIFNVEGRFIELPGS